MRLLPHTTSASRLSFACAMRAYSGEVFTLALTLRWLIGAHSGSVFCTSVSIALVLT